MIELLDMAKLLENIFLTAALVSFVLFFFPTKLRKYFGIAAWTALIAGLFTLLPELILIEGNVIYPVLIVFSVLLLIIGIRHLLKETPAMMDFTRAGGVFCILYVPFAIFKPLGDWLVGTVVYWVAQVFNATGFEYYTVSETSPYFTDYWNFFFSVPAEQFLFGNGGYGDEIVLGCTGITAIALLVAVVFLAHTSWIKKLGLILLVAVPIYIINIFRNVFVINAYFGQWFPWFEEWFAGNPIPGFASYFWSHNIMCEGGAFLVIILLAVLLFKSSPGILSSVKDIIFLFVDEIKVLLRGKKA